MHSSAVALSCGGRCCGARGAHCSCKRDQQSLFCIWQMLAFGRPPWSSMANDSAASRGSMARAAVAVSARGRLGAVPGACFSLWCLSQWLRSRLLASAGPVTASWYGWQCLGHPTAIQEPLLVPLAKGCKRRGFSSLAREVGEKRCRPLPGSCCRMRC